MLNPIHAGQSCDAKDAGPRCGSHDLENPLTLGILRSQLAQAAAAAKGQALLLALLSLQTSATPPKSDVSERNEEPLADLTVDDVARLFGRQPSTIRGWIRKGSLRAYKFNGREYRIPRSAIEELQRAGQERRPAVVPGRRVADLSEWRRTKEEGPNGLET